MKKAKMILSAFAVLAVVGGALAFNARTASVYCTTSDQKPLAGSDACKLLPQTTFSANSSGSSYCTEILNDECSIRANIAFHP